MAQQDEKNIQGGNYPAFPMYNELGNLNAEGLTKREYFAGLFAAQMCAGEAARMVANKDERYDETNWKQVVASNAVEFADALLDALSKQ